MECKWNYYTEVYTEAGSHKFVRRSRACGGVGLYYAQTYPLSAEGTLSWARSPPCSRTSAVDVSDVR